MTFKNIGRGLLFALPGLLFVCVNILGTDFSNFKIGILIFGFVPGFTEEIQFRGMVIPNLMRIFNKAKGIYASLFTAAIIFGVMHITNIFAGANVGTTIFQVFYAFALGVFFGGVLIRTGSLWPSIIIHGLTDFFAFMSTSAADSGAVQTQALDISFDIVPIIVISAFLIF